MVTTIGVEVVPHAFSARVDGFENSAFAFAAARPRRIVRSDFSVRRANKAMQDAMRIVVGSDDDMRRIYPKRIGGDAFSRIECSEGAVRISEKAVDHCYRSRCSAP